MFWIKNEKIVYPCMPQFCYVKVGFKGAYIAWTCYPDGGESVETCNQEVLGLKPTCEGWCS